MKREQAFRPVAGHELERRIALSADASIMAELQLVDMPFGSAAATSASYVEVATTFRGGVPGALEATSANLEQTELRLTVPTASNATTTTESINLPGGLGVANIVDLSTRQGNTTTENITTTLPDGSTTTDTVIQNTHGRTTSIEGWLTTPGVGIETTRGKSVQSGKKMTTSEVIHTPDGETDHERTVLVQSSELQLTGSSTLSQSGRSGTQTTKWNSLTSPLIGS
jgi:hypothetical protein